MVEELFAKNGDDQKMQARTMSVRLSTVIIYQGGPTDLTKARPRPRLVYLTGPPLKETGPLTAEGTLVFNPSRLEIRF